MSNIRPENAINQGVTDRSPTEDAVYQALQGKENTLTKGNLSESTSSVLTVTGGTNAVIGSGTTIEVKAASASQSGYLSSSDWSAFNGKQSALVSGTNIKTVGGVNLLGSGDVGAIGIGYGGTGQTTANAALNALLPSQSSNNGKYLTTDGSNASWASLSSGANTTLSNLDTPTAVNRDLNLNAGLALTGKTGSVVSTGVNAVTPSNSGTTIINTDASITSVLQVGDVIMLEGLTDRLASVVTKNSSTQITVNQALGNGGGGTNKQIQIIKPTIALRNASDVRFASVLNHGNRSIILAGEQGSNRLFVGSLPTSSADKTLIIGNSSSGTGVVVGHNSYSETNGITIGNDTTGIANSVIIRAYGTWTAPYEGIAIGSGTVSPGNYSFHIGMQSNVTVSGTTIGNNITNTTASGNIVIGQTINGGGVTSPATVGGNVCLGYSPGTTYSTFAVATRFYFFGGTNTINIGELSPRYFYLGGGWGQALPTTLTQTFYTNQSAVNGQVNFYPPRGSGIGPGSTVRFLTAPKTSSNSTAANPYYTGLQIDGSQGDVQIGVGSVSLHSVGAGLKIASGTNATVGLATILNGNSDVTVTTNKADTSSLILATNQTSAMPVCVTTKASGSFKIATESPVGADQSIAWFIINTLEDESLAFFSATGITDATLKSAVDRLVKDLKIADMWNRMLAIYPMVGGTATTHKYNLKDPRDLDGAYRLTFSGTWTHSSTGAKGNGTDAYANTNFTPNASSLTSLGWGYNNSAGGATSTLNGEHACLSYYSRTNTNAAINTSVEMGADTNILVALRSNNTLVYELNSASVGTAAHSVTAAGSGYYIINRNQMEAGSGGFNSARELVYWNGSLFTSRSVTNNNAATTPIYLNCYGATGGRYSARECAFAHIGFGLFSELEMIELNRIVVAYQTALGRNV